MENEKFVITEKIIAHPGRRLMNYFVDLIIRVILLFGFAFLLGFVTHFFNISIIAEILLNHKYFGTYLFWVIVSFIYFNFTEMIFSRTFAKYITGTIVVYEEGLEPSNLVIIKRSLSRIIPFDFVSFLYTRGWHDALSNTYVVNKAMLDEELKKFFDLKEIGRNY